MQRHVALLALLVAAPSVLAASAGASATCATGRLFGPGYDYCLFDQRHEGSDDGWNTTTTLGEAGSSVGAPHAFVWLEAVVIRDHEQARDDGVSQFDSTGVTAAGSALYRMSFVVGADSGQWRDDGAGGSTQHSVTTARVGTEDLLLKRVGVTATHTQERGAGCREQWAVEVNLIADTLRIAPAGECRVPLPWLDSGRVSTTAASALP